MTNTKPRLFSEVALDLLSSGQHFTDIHAESKQAVMLRHSAGQWFQPLENGQPIVTTHEELLAFLNGVYGGEELAVPAQSKMPPWHQDLLDNGSLHPATTLSRVIQPDGTELQPKIFTCRVRCTVQRQGMGDAIGLVLRPLREVPESLHTVGLPLQASKMLQAASQGLIIVTGPTGSGKSTTLAAMINEINEARTANILTIEDPIEFVHDRKKSIVNQREVGLDVLSFEAGVRDALRFVPDIILIGEIRDAATMRAALRAAESGHLVISSTHAPTTVSAIRKMMSFLDSQADIQSLAGCLNGVIAQALIPAKDHKKGTLLAYEILNAREPSVVKAILESAGDSTGSKITALEEAVRKGGVDGAMPMMDSVMALIKTDQVEPRSALAAVVGASDKADLLKLSTHSTNAPITPSVGASARINITDSPPVSRAEASPGWATSTIGFMKGKRNG